MNDVVKQTAAVERCEAMAQAVMNARSDERFGQIIGAPGTGKTLMSRHLAARFDGVRMSCVAKEKPRDMLFAVARAFGCATSNDLGIRGVVDLMAPAIRGRLLTVDEANHLDADCLETLRYLPDECGAAVIVFGTPLLDDTMRDGRRATYLQQLRSRIGGKRVVIGPMDTVEEIVAHVIEPRFGPVTKKTATVFLRHSRGDWRTAQALADTCARVLAQDDTLKMDDKTVAAAAAFLAAA